MSQEQALVNNNETAVADSSRVLKPRTGPTNVVQQNFQIANSQGIVFGNVYHNTLNTSTSSSDEKDVKLPRSDVDKLKVIAHKMSDSSDTTKLDNEAIAIMSKHMEETWTDFARKVGFSEGQIYQFKEDHYIRGIKEVIYQMLLEWKQKVLPTFEYTIKLLWKTGNKSVIQYLYDEYWLLKKTKSA